MKLRFFFFSKNYNLTLPPTIRHKRVLKLSTLTSSKTHKHANDYLHIKKKLFPVSRFPMCFLRFFSTCPLYLATIKTVWSPMISKTSVEQNYVIPQSYIPDTFDFRILFFIVIVAKQVNDFFKNGDLSFRWVSMVRLSGYTCFLNLD